MKQEVWKGLTINTSSSWRLRSNPGDLMMSENSLDRIKEEISATQMVIRKARVDGNREILFEYSYIWLKLLKEERLIMTKQGDNTMLITHASCLKTSVLAVFL
jgi:hypothetical protein